jgi:glutathione S-transferase
VSAVLWHIPISHFSEKARWALDWKGIPWEGRAPMPGLHMAVALWLTRGAHKTFPVLQLDGRAIGDSAAIIAALDAYRPDPLLIPADPDERAQALALQGHLDSGLGPAIRLFAFHEVRRDDASVADLAEKVMPAGLMRSERGRAVATKMAGMFPALRYRVASDESAASARETVLEALDRVERQLEDNGGGPYLVGERFSVADLAAASLLMPLARPPEGPDTIRLPPGLRDFRDSLHARPAFRWVLETYARDRRPHAP